MLLLEQLRCFHPSTFLSSICAKFLPGLRCDVGHRGTAGPPVRLASRCIAMGVFLPQARPRRKLGVLRAWLPRVVSRSGNAGTTRPADARSGGAFGGRGTCLAIYLEHDADAPKRGWATPAFARRRSRPPPPCTKVGTFAWAVRTMMGSIGRAPVNRRVLAHHRPSSVSRTLSRRRKTSGAVRMDMWAS